jgi:hypothetical protein
MKCKGDLYFDDDDTIKVGAFILRNEEISFDMTSSWAGGGSWRVVALATRKEGAENEFITGSEKATNVVTGVHSSQCRITFKLKEVSDEFISISGFWSEDAELYEFEGDLEVIK